ncbi:hypothetical protein NNG48_06925 [Enterococcus faecium]|nr:hypothetical protein [Enterococcus faecium]
MCDKIEVNAYMYRFPIGSTIKRYSQSGILMKRVIVDYELENGEGLYTVKARPESEIEFVFSQEYIETNFQLAEGEENEY